MKSVALVSALMLTLLGSSGCTEKTTAPGHDLFATGLIVQDLQVGTGPATAAGDTVTVTFTGTLLDGTVIAASTRKPLVFVIGSGDVIQGLDLGLRGMKAGGERKVTMPPDMGYGVTGVPGVIPPNATLVFDVTLVKLAKTKLLQ